MSGTDVAASALYLATLFVLMLLPGSVGAQTGAEELRLIEPLWYVQAGPARRLDLSADSRYPTGAHGRIVVSTTDHVLVGDLDLGGFKALPPAFANGSMVSGNQPSWFWRARGWPMGWAALDMSYREVALMDMEGAVVARREMPHDTVASRTAPTFEADRAARVWIPVRDPDFYFRLSDEDGVRPWAPRPNRLEIRDRVATMNRVVRRGGEMILLDWIEQEVVRFDSLGTILGRWRLPTGVWSDTLRGSESPRTPTFALEVAPDGTVHLETRSNYESPLLPDSLTSRSVHLRRYRIDVDRGEIRPLLSYFDSRPNRRGWQGIAFHGDEILELDHDGAVVPYTLSPHDPGILHRSRMDQGDPPIRIDLCGRWIEEVQVGWMIDGPVISFRLRDEVQTRLDALGREFPGRPYSWQAPDGTRLDDSLREETGLGVHSTRMTMEEAHIRAGEMDSGGALCEIRWSDGGHPSVEHRVQMYRSVAAELGGLIGEVGRLFAHGAEWSVHLDRRLAADPPRFGEMDTALAREIVETARLAGVCSGEDCAGEDRLFIRFAPVGWSGGSEAIVRVTLQGPDEIGSAFHIGREYRLTRLDGEWIIQSAGDFGYRRDYRLGR